VENAFDRTTLPVLAGFGPDGKRMAEQMLEIIRSRLSSFT
jgi:hypothetical protein